MENFHVDEDIKKAETLPATFYRSDEVFELLKERVFKSSYQWFGSLHFFNPGQNNKTG